MSNPQHPTPGVRHATAGQPISTTPPAPLLPIHPEMTDDPAEVRWIVPSSALRSWPGSDLLLSMVPAVASAGIDRPTDGPAGILVRLNDGETWRPAGNDVRLALLGILDAPQPDKPDTTTADPSQRPHAGNLLHDVLDDVLSGAVGNYVRSHGGNLEVVSVDGDDAVVAMNGVCGACPARGFTMKARVETEVRRRYPELGRLTLER